MNVNCVVLDGARVTFGNHVFVAPGCGFFTAGHPLDVEQRNRGLEIALPITVGDNVWIGGNVSVLPGVNIGEGSIIGAGSVVTHDIPAGVIAVGNPCRVVRRITEADRLNTDVMNDQYVYKRKTDCDFCRKKQIFHKFCVYL